MPRSLSQSAPPAVAISTDWHSSIFIIIEIGSFYGMTEILFLMLLWKESNKSNNNKASDQTNERQTDCDYYSKFDRRKGFAENRAARSECGLEPRCASSEDVSDIPLEFIGYANPEQRAEGQRERYSNDVPNCHFLLSFLFSLIFRGRTLTNYFLHVNPNAQGIQGLFSPQNPQLSFISTRRIL